VAEADQAMKISLCKAMCQDWSGPGCAGLAAPLDDPLRDLTGADWVDNNSVERTQDPAGFRNPQGLVRKNWV